MRASSENKPLARAGTEQVRTLLSIEEVYRLHGDVVLRRAAAILGDPTEALDILQQIFLLLIDNPARFEGRSAVTTWLYRVTTNTCLNRLRDEQNRARLVKRHLEEEGEGRQGDASQWVIARQLIDRMPVDLAQVTVYYAIDGMTHGEIAEVIGCSRRHVGHLLDRAIEWARSVEASSP